MEMKTPIEVTGARVTKVIVRELKKQQRPVEQGSDCDPNDGGDQMWQHLEKRGVGLDFQPSGNDGYSIFVR